MAQPMDFQPTEEDIAEWQRKGRPLPPSPEPIVWLAQDPALFFIQWTLAEQHGAYRAPQGSEFIAKFPLGWNHELEKAKTARLLLFSPVDSTDLVSALREGRYRVLPKKLECSIEGSDRGRYLIIKGAKVPYRFSDKPRCRIVEGYGCLLALQTGAVWESQQAQLHCLKVDVGEFSVQFLRRCSFRA